MSYEDDKRHVLVQAEAHIAAVRDDNKSSILVVVVHADGRTHKVFLGHDSAALLAEIGKVQRFLERVIDENDKMENQAGDFTWSMN